MKAISLWQPYATLIALGVKRFETRHWSTNYRGPLAIHAAKRPARLEECNLDIRAALHRLGHPDLSTLPHGCIVCAVDLTACYTVIDTNFINEGLALGLITPMEGHFGDYTPGRFAWRLDNVRLVDNVPAKGSQGFWEWTPPEGVTL